jgi:hypothetical protein
MFVDPPPIAQPDCQVSQRHTEQIVAGDSVAGRRYPAVGAGTDADRLAEVAVGIC